MSGGSIAIIICIIIIIIIIAIGVAVGVTVNGRPKITSSDELSGQINSPFSFQVVATNNPTEFEITIPETLGLKIDTSGLITGTPKISGSFNGTITAHNKYGNGTQNITINIPRTELPPSITGNLVQNIVENQPFKYDITATGEGPIKFGAVKCDTKSLPDGISLNDNVVSGTVYKSRDVNNYNANSPINDLEVMSDLNPTTGQNMQPVTENQNNLGSSSPPDCAMTDVTCPPGTDKLVLTLSASNDYGTDYANLVLCVVVPSPPTITVNPSSVPAEYGKPFNYQIVATGNITSYGAYNCLDSRKILDNGITIDPKTGILTSASLTRP